MVNSSHATRYIPVSMVKSMACTRKTLSRSHHSCRMPTLYCLTREHIEDNIFKTMFTHVVETVADGFAMPLISSKHKEWLTNSFINGLRGVLENIPSTRFVH